MLKKQRKTRQRKHLAAIKLEQSNTTVSARFLSTALHSASQAVIRSHTYKISLYNNMDTAFCADSGSLEYMFPDYSTFKTYHCLYNRYATLGDTNRLTIEVIGTTVYTLNGRTILTRKDLHIPALQGLLYSLCKHRQIPGCGVYSSYKDGSYLFFPDFIIQLDYSWDNIVRYPPLGTSHQGPIDYIEPIATTSTSMDTPSGCSSLITSDPTPQSPHIIPSDEESVFFQPHPPPSIDIAYLPQPPTKVPPTEPRNATMHKNSIEPLSSCTPNLVHKDTTNIPHIPPSLAPAPFKNQTQFKSLNLHYMFGCRQFPNQKHLPAATNASLANSGLLPSTIGSFPTITNPYKQKTITKRRQCLDKFHINIVFGDCVALGVIYIPYF